MLVAETEGNYRYLPGAGEVPFCNAVIADTGYEVVRATLERPLPYRAGFEVIERHLKAQGRPRAALCGVELRCSRPYTPDGFRAFNEEYSQQLGAWGKHRGAPGTGSTARTNIAPLLHAPAEQVLFAFSYTLASPATRPTFVVSGAAAGRGDGAPATTREKVASIVAVLEGRLRELGVSWDLTTEVVVYAPRDIEDALHAALLPRIGACVLNGVRWFPGRAPVVGSEIELGTHGVLREVRVPVD